MANDVNMNMISVWGGGIYEKDIFYNLCDELGILVWQYFMFSCGECPDYDAEFIEEVKIEVESVVIRLRNHACIAIWVGNVKNQMLSQKIGLKRECMERNYLNHFCLSGFQSLMIHGFIGQALLLEVIW